MSSLQFLCSIFKLPQKSRNLVESDDSKCAELGSSCRMRKKAQFLSICSNFFAETSGTCSTPFLVRSWHFTACSTTWRMVEPTVLAPKPTDAGVVTATDRGSLYTAGLRREYTESVGLCKEQLHHHQVHNIMTPIKCHLRQKIT